MTTRLMCSRDRKEVEAVKTELFRNGIRSEIRNNPVAEALRVSRVELWLNDECDYFKASKVYVAFQERGTPGSPKAAEREPAPQDTSEVYVEAEELPYAPAPHTKPPPANPPSGAKSAPSQPLADAAAADGSLAEVSGLLEQEIDDLLARDAELNARYVSLEKTAESLRKSLGAAEARAAAESSARAAAEKKALAATELQSSLKRDLAERATAAERLELAVAGLRKELKARDQAAAAASAKVETHARELREQQALLVALRGELSAREQQLKELGDILTQAGVDLGTEKQARTAAEERLSQCSVARAALEQQAAAQIQEIQQTRAELKAREAQLQAFVGKVNALRGKFHGKT
jgi:hypothetical protein